jgi:hypothetical protein
MGDTPDWSRLHTNFLRRHKWVASIRATDESTWDWPGLPHWQAFVQDWTAVSAVRLSVLFDEHLLITFEKGDRGAESVREGVQLLEKLANDGPDGAAVRWTATRKQVSTFI